MGNLVYYLCLASAIQRAGGPLPTMIIGTLPVVIAITSNLRDAKRDGKLPWLKLVPSLYTIWKRTAAPPTMLLFDSPNREICTVKRSRTNTPLQALALLNEVSS